MLGKHRLRATKCTNAQRHRSSWGEYMLDTVVFVGQIAVWGHPPGHTRIFAEIWQLNPVMIGKPRLQATKCANDQRNQSRGESICSIRWRLRVKSPPPGIQEFWREINMWTHAYSENSGYELQDAPMLNAIGAREESICSIRSRLRAKSPHFDRLDHAPLTGLRISMASRISPEIPFHVVF